jgi:hypothetical protein
MMKPVYVGDDFDPERPSIFLAGPSPRSKVPGTWRDEALFILQRHDFEGDVFVPLTKDGNYLYDHKEGVRWEWRALGAAACIAFWIPRSDLYPGFTTNIEFGFASVLRPGRVVLGAPPDATKIRYPKMMAREMTRLGEAFGADLKNIHVYETLADTLEIARRIVRFA